MYEKLVSYAAKQLELNADEITPDSTFESLGVDSLDIVEMIMDLESELGVELEIEDQERIITAMTDREISLMVEELALGSPERSLHRSGQAVPVHCQGMGRSGRRAYLCHSLRWPSSVHHSSGSPVPQLEPRRVPRLHRGFRNHGCLYD